MWCQKRPKTLATSLYPATWDPSLAIILVAATVLELIE